MYEETKTAAALFCYYAERQTSQTLIILAANIQNDKEVKMNTVKHYIEIIKHNIVYPLFIMHHRK